MVSVMVVLVEVEVVEEQRLLNGMRSVTLEGTSPDWSLSLTYARPKDSQAGVLEADLTLSGAGGELSAALQHGRADPLLDAVLDVERESIDLWFAFEDGEGCFAGRTGTARLTGILAAGAGLLQVDITLGDEGSLWGARPC